jgi:tRNA acetyltransferase TAN1
MSVVGSDFDKLKKYNLAELRDNTISKDQNEGTEDQKEENQKEENQKEENQKEVKDDQKEVTKDQDHKEVMEVAGA